MSVDAATTFLQAHPPAGMRASSRGYEGRPGASVNILIDSVVPLPGGICFAWLVFSIGPDGAGKAMIRADGQAMDDCTKGTRNSPSLVHR